METIWEWKLIGNTIKDWTIALGIIAIASLLFRLLQSVVVRRLQLIAKRTESTFDDFIVILLRKSIMPFLYILAFYFGMGYLTFPEKTERIIHIALLSATTWFVIKIIVGILGYVFDRFARNNSSDKQAGNQTKGILLLVKIVLWMGGVLFLVDNLGYNITTIVTGLGIGGIAIALAAQAVLADLFSYLVIFFDKPFETGDFILLGDKTGVVEYIGVKTTRLRTLSGEQLIVSNTDLTNSRVHNFKRMEKRRVLFSIGVAYETPVAKLRQIPGMIKTIIERTDGTSFERVHFAGFGDFSLNYEIVFHMLTPDYAQFMEIRQEVFLAIKEQFEKETIEFAYPTQKILVSPAVTA